MRYIINQWPILSPLPMCTTDAGPSIDRHTCTASRKTYHSAQPLFDDEFADQTYRKQCGAARNSTASALNGFLISVMILLRLLSVLYEFVSVVRT